MELLLPRAKTIKNTIASIFTFQYGATATVDTRIKCNRSIYIYIPIWSYCYPPTISQQIITQLHLHSNMELLLLCTAIIIHLLIHYLHSNMELLLPSKSDLYPLTNMDLHSNMELLLLILEKLIYLTNYKFTFQYGATAT